MSRPEPPLSPLVRTLLEQERNVKPLTAPIRDRALARARAALIAGRVGAAVGITNLRPRARWGVAVAAASVASIAVGTTAYEIGVHQRPVADAVSTPVVRIIVTSAAPSVAPPVVVVDTPSSAVVVDAPPTTATNPVAPPVSPASRTALGTTAPDELRLLQQARAAVARQDFAAALAPIAEHARRFTHGRLAEEREALRVKALSGLGRSEEARRAADAFESRFPRSVLVPSVAHMPDSRP
jgi:hypothetical protein